MNQNYPQLPQAFENCLLQYLKNQYLQKKSSHQSWNARDTEYFAKGILRLNDIFTENQSDRYDDYFNDPVKRSGYLAYFLPVNASKLYHLLNKHDTNFLSAKTSYHIADIGAGPLTMSFGFLFFLIKNIKANALKQKITLTIDAYEQNKKILRDGLQLLDLYLKAENLTEQLSVHVNAFPINLNTHKFHSKTYDYILCGNIFNESPQHHQQFNLAQSLIEKFLTIGGKLVIIEPAAKKSSRDLQNLRDQILNNTALKIIAPCLHQQTCPLNVVAKNDWCHTQYQWQSPSFIQAFDHAIKMKKNYLLFSYLFFLWPKNTHQVPKHSPQEFIAMSHMMKGKGQSEWLGCGSTGYARFVRKDNEISSTNRIEDFLQRGQKFIALKYESSQRFEQNQIIDVKKDWTFK